MIGRLPVTENPPSPPSTYTSADSALDKSLVANRARYSTPAINTSTDSARMITRPNSFLATERESATKAFGPTAAESPSSRIQVKNPIGLRQNPAAALDIDSNLASLGFGKQHEVTKGTAAPDIEFSAFEAQPTVVIVHNSAQQATIPSPDKWRYVVAPDGPADFKSIQQAINRAAPGDIVAVKPGVYRETLVLTKPLELVGDGRRDDILIENENGDCLSIRYMSSTTASVKGLSFRRDTGGSAAIDAAVVVTEGNVQIEDCDIQADRNGLVIVGNKAKVRVRDCRIHDCREGSGLFVTDRGNVSIENCDIFNSQQGFGIHVGHYGIATITKCRILKNAKDGARVSHKGNVQIQQSVITENRRYGVSVGEAKAEIIECELGNNFRGTHHVYMRGEFLWKTEDVGRVPTEESVRADAFGTAKKTRPVHDSASAMATPDQDVPSTATDPRVLLTSRAIPHANTNETREPDGVSPSILSRTHEGPLAKLIRAGAKLKLPIKRPKTEADSDAEKSSSQVAVSSHDDIAPPPTTDAQTPKLVLREEVESIEEQPVPSVVEPEPIVEIAEQVVVEAKIAEPPLSSVERIGDAPAGWIPRLLASALFESQIRMGGRNPPTNDLIEKLLCALDQRGGKLTSAALARALDFPDGRLRGLIAKLEPILNREGEMVLQLDELSETVELNRDLLLMQFELN